MNAHSVNIGSADWQTRLGLTDAQAAIVRSFNVTEEQIDAAYARVMAREKQKPDGRTVEQLRAENEILLDRLNRSMDNADMLLVVCETWETTCKDWQLKAWSTVQLWNTAMKERVPWELSLIWSGIAFIAGLVVMEMAGAH
jgi:hypothetical protein